MFLEATLYPIVPANTSCSLAFLICLARVRVFVLWVRSSGLLGLEYRYNFSSSFLLMCLISYIGFPSIFPAV